ncbi:hypothetical protein B1992_10995 [Pseudoxanthomonas broegbernensis]|uniref:ApeI dehydratase-like domain-containing protein n=1 Tax=Pseudoxanthomonas broegbernensis TaxID=83619 RepID=A0A7V8GLB7_9GAMM|nr:hypothetical protein [Pseudoxanthomonas broegbernensis]KAF1685715.1 hypothetical protein B1992_10995 [Pseudoxanthomonas broegbernensis]MBB6066064.1 3-hydroxymyristoyl/3-hydroxydecanoyl-(acyl carrier protein) dehydratase [Pseudoxanthomonas broegbernensis]
MRFAVPHDHPCLAGHFPGCPLVPGVVVLERVLEAIEAECGRVGALCLPQVKFLRPLLPGQEAEVVLAGTAPRWRFEVRGAVGPLARGEIRIGGHD